MVIQCNPFVANPPPVLKSWEIRLPTPPLVDAPAGMAAGDFEQWLVDVCNVIVENDNT